MCANVRLACSARKASVRSRHDQGLGRGPARAASRTRAVHARARRRPARRRRHAARSIRPRPTSRTGWAATRATSTPAPGTPPARRWSATWPRSRAARHGFAFGSGLAAVDAVLKLLSAGDHVVCGENVYGGTHRQMTHIWARLGLSFTFVDGGDLDAVAAAVTPRDEDGLRRDADQSDDAAVRPRRRRRDRRSAPARCSSVDNTFATPVLPAAARARRRHRAPLDDQVSERPQRHGRRHAGHVARRPGRAARASSRTPPGAVPGTVRLLAGAARHQDARRCACASTTPTAAASPSGSTHHPRVQQVYYPGCPRIRSTTSPAAR